MFGAMGPVDWCMNENIRKRQMESSLHIGSERCHLQCCYSSRTTACLHLSKQKEQKKQTTKQKSNGLAVGRKKWLCAREWPGDHKNLLLHSRVTIMCK